MAILVHAGLAKQAATHIRPLRYTARGANSAITLNFTHYEHWISDDSPHEYRAIKSNNVLLPPITGTRYGEPDVRLPV